LLLRFQKKYLLVFLFALIMGWGLYENIIARPFPFFNVQYTQEKSAFQAAPEHFPIPLKLNDSLPPLPVSYVQQSFLKDIRYAVDLARQTMRQSKGHKIRTLQTVFSLDTSFMNICSENAKVFVSIMAKWGYTGRVIWMNGHTIAEVWDGTKWVLVDPHGNVLAKHENGNYLSLIEVNQNFENVEFERASQVMGDGLTDYLQINYLSNPDNVYKKQNLFFIISAEDLFEFHSASRDVSDILTSLTGSPSVGEGYQLVTGSSEMVGNMSIHFLRRFGHWTCPEKVECVS